MKDKRIVINFKDITKEFDKIIILDNLNLKIFEEEILLIVGKSGSGKSTLFKILLGLYKPDYGFIFYNSKNLVYYQNEIRKIVGFVSQNNSFYDKLTVEENIIFFAKLYNVSMKDIIFRLNYLLDLVNLKFAQNYLAEKLSGGMKRRLEFAISLVHNPVILILDEPFTGLDIKLRDELWNVLKNIKNSGVTILISTHQLSVAQKHSDRVVFLHNRKIVKDLNIRLLKSGFDLEKIFFEVISK